MNSRDIYELSNAPVEDKKGEIWGVDRRFGDQEVKEYLIFSITCPVHPQIMIVMGR